MSDRNALVRRQFGLDGLKAILFDLGGTLDGPGQPWVDRFATIYREAGVVVPFERLRDAVGHGTREAYRCPEIAGYDLRATVACHVAGQLARLEIEDGPVALGIIDAFVQGTTAALAESRGVLERLARRFKLGVVSNYYGNAERILADAGLAPLLAAVVDSAVCGLSKPDPAIFVLALARVGVEAREALFVGDSLQQDMIPARAAGLHTAWMVGPREPPVTSPADMCVRSLVDLERLLLS